MTSLHRLFAGLSAAVVLVALVWGAWLAGSPLSERQRRFDDRRIEHLRGINNEIYNIVYDGKVPRPDGTLVPEHPLPATLAEVREKALYQKVDIEDPESGEPYEYSVTDATHYQLCAEFSHLREQQYDIIWNHPAGHHCFAFDITDLNRR